MQNTSQLLMIRPVSFGFNAETAVNNSFQHIPAGDVQQKALAEFLGLAALLQQNNVGLTVVDDRSEPHTPDSVFPNNWFSTDEDGRLFLYPMFAPNRRLEREAHVLDAIRDKFTVHEIADLSAYENRGLYLEGTGSMVLDRVNRIAYACLSPRTSIEVLDEYCRRAGFRAVCFTATEPGGTSIYHTNVMMCVADRYAVVCLEAIPDADEKESLEAALLASGKAIIEISTEQLNCFAGNMLQVLNVNGEVLLIMSDQAYGSLNAGQKNALAGYNRIVHACLDTIEAAGGGSARCMLAEIFLELK